MEVGIQSVIDKLGLKIAKLEVENAVLQTQLETVLQKQAEKEAEGDGVTAD